MKKLKLKALDIQATEVLSREELKKVLGGDGSSGGDGSAGIFCKDSSVSCTIMVQGNNGSWVPFNGNCGWHFVLVAGSHVPYCYCITSLGPVDLSSNGGQSRCSNL